MVNTGKFLYPPPDTVLTYNYKDTVLVSWETLQPNATECYLTLWYWDLHQGDAWQSNYNSTVAVNGTSPVALNILGQAYYGQFNYNYTLTDGSSGLYLSSFFNVNYDSSQSAVTWGTTSTTATTTTSSTCTTRTSATTTTTTTSSSSSISTSTATASAASGADLSNPPSQPTSSASAAKATNSSSSGLSGGAIAGIVIGVVAAVVGAIIIGGFIFFRKRKTRPAPQPPVVAEVPPSEPYPTQRKNYYNKLGDNFSSFPKPLTELPESAMLSELSA